MGLRTRLFLATAAVVVTGTVITALLLARGFEAWFDRRAVEEMEREARVVREVLLARGDWPAPRELDALVDGLGEALGLRVTVILADGSVVADSEVERERLGRLDNHADRPEVRLALREGQGAARRFSTTLEREQIYVALRFDAQGRSGVVRVASAPAALAETVWGLYRVSAAAVGAGLLLAIALAALAAQLISRRLYRLLHGMEALARGESGRLLAPRAAGDLGRVAGSFQRLGEGLRRTIDELSAERDRFKQVLDSMASVVIVVDAEGRIALANEAARRVLRIEGPARGRLLLDAIRAPDVAELLEHDSVTPLSSEFELPGPPGLRLIARVVPLAGGRRLVVMDDVTERRRLETMRRDFVANVSHELRTPVSVILANAETLVDGEMADETTLRRFLGAIHANAQRLSRLIADLLDLSRIEAGRLGLELESVPLQRAFDRVLDAVRDEAERKDHALTVTVPDGLCVRADGQALDQVMHNLVDNAVKYTPPGGHITLSAEPIGDDRVRIEVQDDGPGIEPRHQQRVFERFYRVDPGRSREVGGTGLGLAIVKHLVESMGGRVGVEPATPRGSRFWLELQAERRPEAVAGS